MNFVDRDGCRIAYRDEGHATGPAVVFSHSLGLDHQSWDSEAERLGERFRVVRIDTRGHGRSDAPRGDYTLEQLGRDLIAVADRLEIERFHTVGLSLGGLTALWLAVHEPYRLISATYCNTAAKLGTDTLWRARIAAVADGMAAIEDDVFPRFFTPGFADRHASTVERVRRVFLATRPHGYAGCCAALRDADLRAMVSAIETPSLIIGGLEDVATPPAQSRWLHGQITDSRLVLLERAAHLSNLERPAAFGDALVEHLRAS